MCVCKRSTTRLPFLIFPSSYILIAQAVCEKCRAWKKKKKSVCVRVEYDAFDFFELPFSSTHLLHKRCVRRLNRDRRGGKESCYKACYDA